MIRVVGIGICFGVLAAVCALYIDTSIYTALVVYVLSGLSYLVIFMLLAIPAAANLTSSR